MCYKAVEGLLKAKGKGGTRYVCIQPDNGAMSCKNDRQV